MRNRKLRLVPSAWGRRPFQKPVEEVIGDLRRRKARRAIFIDLNLIADKPYAARLFEALIPEDVEKRFYDDRLEVIPYDEPTDLVAISVETYTAKRAYQIASEARP